jgi:hypothetical protein
MNMIATSETAILARMIAPQEAGFSEEFARYVLDLDFASEDRDRMAILAEKARQGDLSPKEQELIERYERLGHFLSLLKSKARRSIQESAT